MKKPEQFFIIPKNAEQWIFSSEKEAEERAREVLSGKIDCLNYHNQNEIYVVKFISEIKRRPRIMKSKKPLQEPTKDWEI